VNNSKQLQFQEQFDALPWWKKGTVYQVYPRSFQDSNGDGVGDIRGIISRLDYLQQLGIVAIWLSPVYQDGGVDAGYDISDYQQINPLFGNMQDMEHLISEAKMHGIRIIMDLVVNHTSDKHPWFIDSRSSKSSTKRDWYIWRDGVVDQDGNLQAPNDIPAMFSGNAWQYDETSGQYYFHMFTKEQPDLNWHNSEVRSAIYDMMNFWLNKGIGGFRMDVINLIGKNVDQPYSAVPQSEQTMTGAPNEGIAPINVMMWRADKTHQYLQEMNGATFGSAHSENASDQYLTVGECGFVTTSSAQQFSNPARSELSQVFQFEIMDFVDTAKDQPKWCATPFNVPLLRDLLCKWQTALADTSAAPGWNSLFWGNHDQPRILNRILPELDSETPEKIRVKSAKALAILLHCLKGTPYIYQGEEIGMTNYPWRAESWREDFRDIEAINAINIDKIAFEDVAFKTRDNARTPMQWDASPNAGFTDSKTQPWIAVHPNYCEVNVARALNDNNSIFMTYQQLNMLRQNEPILALGSFEMLSKLPEQVIAYTRQLGEEKWLVVVNMSNTEVALPANFSKRVDNAEVVISSNPSAPGAKISTLEKLAPFDAYALKL
jgi:glucan 1,6-alpha-glucosidase